jgi:trk system potassium uptake protein TrkH
MKLINPLIILRILSTVILIEAISFLFCLPVAFIYDEPYRPFIVSAAIAGLIWLITFQSTGKAAQEKMSNRDGFIAVTLSWLVFSAAGTLPYVLSGSITFFVDAFFECASGFTTTGATILRDIESLPYSILFWRSLTHWIGGLGIIVLAVIVLPSLGITGYKLFTLESSLKEKIHPQIKAVGFRILFIYLGLTLAHILFLLPGDMNFFDSVCHSFATVATGGFSTKNASLSYFSPYSQYVVMIFMFLAGINQVVFYYLFKFNFKKIAQNDELKFYFIVCTVAGLSVTSILLFYTNTGVEESFRHGFFNVISIITTTGFYSFNYIVWPIPALMIIFLLLFAGASTGSTTGSIKMARHLIILKNIKSIFNKITHPNAVSNIKFNGVIINEKTNISILSFVVLYMFFFLIGSAILVLGGTDTVTAMSSVATCLGNIGPGLGTNGPAQNYFQYSDFDTIVLSLLMIIGRLEILTVFTLFTKSFWKL